MSEQSIASIPGTNIQIKVEISKPTLTEYGPNGEPIIKPETEISKPSLGETTPEPKEK